MFSRAKGDSSSFTVTPDSVDVQEYFILVINGEVLQRPMNGPKASRVDREFTSYEDAVRFGAGLLGTGHIDTFQIESIFRHQGE